VTADPPAALEALEALAARVRGGDAGAFRELVDRSHETIYRVAAALVNDRDEAADVVQETYVRAWDRRGELRDPAAVLGWLCRIARNAAHDRRHGWWSRVRARLDEAGAQIGARAGEGPAPDEALGAAQAAAAVRRAVASLPEGQRVVLVLREVEGMTYEEIAEALDLPLGTVESRLHRARKGLARLLEAWRREEERS
jgi:RNA polymerase sigma-70 factor (ECF subfamily)